MDSKIRNITKTAIFTAILCIISPFSVPIGPVPISLATFAVYLFSIILGVKKSLIGIAVYILIGFAGLPVFSNGGAGAGALFGPTGGYLMGYFFCSLGTSLGDLAGIKFFKKSAAQTAVLIAGMIIGTAILYLFGTIWLSYFNNLDIKAAFAAGVIPFIPGDAVKIAAAAILAKPLKKRL